jgi:hypothetical protein
VEEQKAYLGISKSMGIELGTIDIFDGITIISQALLCEPFFGTSQ